MSSFIYPVNYPSTKTELHFKELSYKHFKDFVKTVLNNDKQSLCLFIDTLLSELCVEQVDFAQISSFDKFYMLTFLYGTNISTTIQFTLKCPVTKKAFNYTLDLATLLEKIDALALAPKHIETVQKVQYHFGYPAKFIETIDSKSIVEATIRGASSKRGPIDVTNENKAELIKNLPIPAFKKVSNWLNEQNNLLQTVDFLGVKSPHATEDTIIKFLPSLFGNSLLEFIKCLFRDNLTDIYKTEYDLIRNHKFTFDMFSQITPAELTIYQNIDKEKVKKGKELPSKQPIVK